MNKKIFFIFILLLPILACVSTPAQPTQNVDVIVQATFQALTLQAVEGVSATSTPISETTVAPTDVPVLPTNTTIATGSIAGNLSYPSSFIPAQTIVAFDANSTNYFYVNTADNQSAYQIDNLPAGNYYIVTYTQDGALSAGYSQAVPCGLLASCTDHSLISVNVTAGNVTNGINPQDWYAPPDSFPSYPLP